MKYMQRARDRFLAVVSVLFALGSIVMMSACGASGSQEETFSQASGFIEAKRYSVSSETGGLISQILVSQGEEVSQSDLLVIIDSSQFQELLIQGEAAVSLAEAELAEMRSRPDTANVTAAEAHVADAYAELVAAEAALETLEELYKPYDPPDRDVHAAESGVAIAEANHALAKAQLDQIQAGPLESEIRIAEAALEEAQANMELINLQITRSNIRAPISGVIDQILVNVGETVFPGVSIIEVFDPQNLSLTVFVPVTDVTQVSVGQKVEINVDAYPGLAFNGEVTRIADQAQFTPTNVQTTEERVKLVFAIEILVDDPDGLLHGGMPADVDFNP